MEVLQYQAKLNPQDGGYLVSFPDVLEAITEGDTLEEALERAADALKVSLSSYPDRNLDIPTPQKSETGHYSVSMSARVATKLALYTAWRSSGMTKTELARRIGIS